MLEPLQCFGPQQRTVVRHLPAREARLQSSADSVSVARILFYLLETPYFLVLISIRWPFHQFGHRRPCIRLHQDSIFGFPVSVSEWKSKRNWFPRLKFLDLLLE